VFDADSAGGMVIISPAIWACVTPLVLDVLQQIFLARLSIMGKTVSIFLARIFFPRFIFTALEKELQPNS
jgi:hypothetical protein